MNAAALIFFGVTLGADPVPVRLDPRQELIWNGTFTEHTHRSGVKATRLYDFEARLLVLGLDRDGAEAALLTTLRLQTPSGKEDATAAPVSQLSLIHVARNGKVRTVEPITWYEGRQREYRPRPIIPIDELPTDEVGMFLHFPAGSTIEGRVWDETEPARPARTWKIEGTEQPRGATCLRIHSEQESDDWAQGSSRGQSFRLKEHLMLPLDVGIACKLERIIETKDPNSPDVTFRSTLKYEQTQRSRLTGEGFRERQEEIRQILWTQVVLQQLATQVGRDPRPFEGVLNSLQTYQMNYPDREELPYREVLNRLKERTELARRGLQPPDPKQTRFHDLIRTGLRINDAAPDFLVRQVDSPEQMRLKRLRGKPVVLVYVQPDSLDFLLMLQTCHELTERFRDRVHIVPLLAGKTAQLEERKRSLNLKLPLYEGDEVFARHQVNRFPLVGVLDRDGVLRALFEQWNNGARKQLEVELERWLK